MEYNDSWFGYAGTMESTVRTDSWHSVETFFLWPGPLHPLVSSHKVDTGCSFVDPSGQNMKLRN
jgi:hypothetical protein